MASIKPEELDTALRQQLTLYGQRVSENCYAAGKKAVEALVSATKPTAPVRLGGFRKSIASKELSRSAHSFLFAWYVKKPHYRKTHLLVKGHAKQNGGRVQGNSFLADAMATVLPEFEKDMEDAAKDDS